MITLLYFLLSFLSLGAIAGAILLSNYLRKSYPAHITEYYFYYIVLMCAFGIYGIWGIIFIKFIISQFSTSLSIVTILSQAIPYIGFPFLIMAWYMYLKFCYEFAEINVSKTLSVAYFSFHLFFFITLGWAISQSSASTINLPNIGLIYIYVTLDVIMTGWGLMILFIKSRKRRIEYAHSLTKYILITFALLVLKIVSVYIYYHIPSTIPAFILLYFLALTVPLVYFYGQRDEFIALIQKLDPGSDYDRIIARYGITNREQEIIKQVCTGKSNQEIADTLFISLQTVKDHTHRIYLKMDIKSRVQLIKLMQDVFA